MTAQNTPVLVLPERRRPLKPCDSWTCWVCGDTHAKNGTPLTTAGRVVLNHLRIHAMEGLVRPATPQERKAGSTFFTLTLEGQAFVERRQLDPTTPRPPALPRPGTRSRRVYDTIAEFPGVRLLAVEIADECELPLQLASAFAHQLVHQGVVQIETGGRGRQAEFWVEP